MFTGSYDGTLRVWEISDLFAEKSGNNKNLNAASKPTSSKNTSQASIYNRNRTPQKLNVENEKAYYNTSKRSVYDQRSEADSGFDDRDFYDKYSRQQLPQTRHFQVKSEYV